MLVSHKTISMYLLSLYCRYYCLITVMMAVVLTFSSAFDLLQKFKAIYISTGMLWKLIIYKMPYLIVEMSIFICFVTTLYFFKIILKYNELVIMLCSGISMWRILIIPIVVSSCIGAVVTTIIHPIGAYGLQKYELLEAKLTNKKPTSVTVSKTGIFFFEEYKNQHRILHSKSINLTLNELYNVTVLIMDTDNNFTQRLDAPKATMFDGNLQFTTPHMITLDTNAVLHSITIPTTFSMATLMSSFTAPEIIPFWNLPHVIDKLTQSGLPTINYQLYYYKQLFRPLTMITAVILASCFYNITGVVKQRYHQHRILIYGVSTSLVVHAAIEIMIKTLTYHGIAPVFSVLLPVLLLILIGNFIILHLHEA